MSSKLYISDVEYLEVWADLDEMLLVLTMCNTEKIMVFRSRIFSCDVPKFIEMLTAQNNLLEAYKKLGI